MDEDAQSIISMDEDQQAVNRYESAVFEAEGCKCQDVKQYISVYLAMANNSEDDTVVYGVFSLYLLDQKNHNDFILPDPQDEKKERCFHKWKQEWGFDQFIHRDKFEDPGNGYIVNDSCALGSEIVSVRKVSVTGKGEFFLIPKEVPASKHTWRIEKFSRIKAKVIYSKIFSAGEQDWKIEVYPDGTGYGERKHLSLFLSLADPIASKGRIYAEVTLRILDQAKDRHIIAKDKFWFDESSTRHGWSRFTPLYHLYRSKNSLLVKDVCIVEAEVKVLGLANAL